MSRAVVELMGLHKLTAGDGYTYLTRQVAVSDATDRGYRNLGDYYAQRGESPGLWTGAGLASLDVSGDVSEAQMRALFGEGRHPNADTIEFAVVGEGGTPAVALKASALGRSYPIHDAEPSVFRRLVAQQLADWNTDRDLPHNEPVPTEVKAQIRTQVATQLFAEERGRPPDDARELSGFIARASRQSTTAVAGYDLTFSPVKSVSVLWATAPRPVSEQVEAAHHAAVADALRWLEREVAFTREGPAGVRQVPVRGLLAAAFVHRDSRAGDPDLHTHVAVSNKVQTLDGRWLALDARTLYKAKVAASEYYNTRLEAHLTDRIGVRFAERALSVDGKRPVREIVGVDARLSARWSSRRRSIEHRQAELSAGFQAEHGRPPTPVEAIALAQQANLETRDQKHAPRSHAAQREAWRAEAIAELGSAQAVSAMVYSALAQSRTLARLDDSWCQTAAVRVIATVEADRATWQVWHVRAEALRVVRPLALPAADIDATIDRLVSIALSPQHSLAIGSSDGIREPGELRRPDGASVYDVAGSRLYTSRRILAAERALVAAAQRHDGRMAEVQTIEIALLESAANGVTLTPGQAQFVRELATSGARLQLGLAPAGTGKTTAIRVLANAWTDSGGTILGLAPSANAAAVLRDVLGAHTDTLAKLCHGLIVGDLPDWVARIGPDTLVVIDEAGLAGTIPLVQAVEFVLSRGGSVRLVADDQQLAAIGAGGVLRDIAHSAGAVALSQVVRFTDQAEAAASLAIRAGDSAAVGFYLDEHRVRVGDQTTVIDQAYAAWAADRGAGLTSVMLAPTRDIASALNARARADRLRQGSVVSREVVLADGLRASAGDIVLTRRNDRRLALTPVDFVKNGDRWIVEHVHPTGEIDVCHIGLGTRIALPASYVADATELGYATTIHTAQGITTDSAHSVLTGEETRQLLYVALTRGRAANHVYLTTAGDGDPHTIIRPEALRPPTATDILTAILARDGAQQSATAEVREATDAAARLRDAVARYTDALAFAAEKCAGPAVMGLIDAAAEHIHPCLAEAAAYSTLCVHLALLACDGTDPVRALHQAAEARELHSTLDPAAVLDWRIGASRPNADGPLPWLPGIPTTISADDRWGPYLSARASLVRDLAERTAADARAMSPSNAPGWAAALIDEHRDILADLTVWRAATAVRGDDPRPTGPPRQNNAAERYRRELARRSNTATGTPETPADRWADVLRSIEPRIMMDECWQQLAEKLSAADRAGVEIARLAINAAAERPLPDERPAAALWWRLARHLSPAVLNSNDHWVAAPLDPGWAADLKATVGADRAERVRVDAAWPALVAAVAQAQRAGWRAPDLLEAAAAFATGVTGEALLGHQLAEALVWRVTMLSDPDPVRDPWDEAAAPPGTQTLDQVQLTDDDGMLVEAHQTEPAPVRIRRPTYASPIRAANLAERARQAAERPADELRTSGGERGRDVTPTPRR